jgi:tryptophan-rich hypothetical protein
LPGSKWTALQPVNQEKHFVIHDWVEPGSELLEVEAIQSRRVFCLNWKRFKNSSDWKMGWH